MKNNYRIIKFLRQQFRFCYYLFIANLIVGAMLSLTGLFFPDFPLAELFNIRFNCGSFLWTPISFQFLGEDVVNNATVKVLLREVIYKGFNYRLFAFFDNAILSITLALLFKNAKVLFENLAVALKTGDDFNQENYLRIKRIGYWFAAFVLYRLVNGILFSHFLLKDIIMFDQKIKFHPNYIEWSLVSFVLIIFVFAEIYKVAVNIKEESELTI